MARTSWQGLDVRGKHTAVSADVVIQPVDAGIDQADHVLRAGRVGKTLVFRLVKFAHQSGGVALWQAVVP